MLSKMKKLTSGKFTPSKSTLGKFTSGEIPEENVYNRMHISIVLALIIAAGALYLLVTG